MKMIKGNEIIKVAVAVVLSIALFYAAFVGVNNLAFAAATDKTEDVLPFVADTARQTAAAATATTTAAATNAATSTAAATNAAETASVATAAAAAPEDVPSALDSNGYPKSSMETASNVTVAAGIPTIEAAAGILAISEAAGIPAKQNVPSEEYQKPNMTVYQNHNEWYTPNANTIAYEEAAEIGARYIWTMFGESIDGKTVEMNYSAWPSHSRTYWGGSVADSREKLNPKDTDNYDVLYSFLICAVSGEWIDISNYQTQSADEDKRTINMLRALTGLSNEEAEDIQRQRYAYPPPERLDEYIQMTKDYAAKHFAGAEVASIELCTYGSYGTYDLDDNGDVIIVPAKYLAHTVTSSTGRTADVTIKIETMELVHIITQHNDIVPGYNYDAPGGVG